MMKFRILLFAILILALIGISSAADYTNTINSSQNVYTNKSYQMSDNASTPIVIFILIAASGFYLLLFSIISDSSQGSDIFGLLSVPILGAATWTSRALDVITSGGSLSTSSGIVVLESHTIYSNPVLTVIFFIIFVVSLLNTYRIFVIARGSDPDEYTDSDR